MALTRRSFLKVSAAGVAGLALPKVLEPLPAFAAARCQWGAFPDPSPDHCATLPDTCGPEDLMPAVYDFEALIGRKLGVTRHYPNWDYPIPNDVIKESARTGHVPLIAWRPQKLDGTWISWADLPKPRGPVHTEIVKKAKAIAAWNRRAYFVFHHEPENAYRRGLGGTPAEFQAAFNAIRQIFTDNGVRKLTYVATLQRVTYDGANGGASAWLPSGCDLIGVDGYNRGACASDHLWKPFPEVFDSAHEYALSIGKGMVIEEWGSVRSDVCGGAGTQTQADWIRQAGDIVQAWAGPTAGVKAMIYTHSLADFKGVPVDFRIDQSPDTLAAFKEVGARPIFT